MKTNSNSKIIRHDLNKGNYSTIHNSVLRSVTLTDSAKVLIQILLNNDEDWNISLEYYRKLFGWSKDKLSGIVENLIDNGFLRKDKHPKGKGFFYYYTVSEFGNLKPQKTAESIQEITEPIQEKLESNTAITKTLVKTENNSEKQQEKWMGMVLHFVDESSPWFNLTVDYLYNKFKTELLPDDATLLDSIRHYIVKQLKDWVTTYINENASGTIAQRQQNKDKLQNWLNESIQKNNIPTEHEIRQKYLALKQTNSNNRILDPKYND